MLNQPERRGEEVWVSEADLHPHLLARMRQRGVSAEEMGRTLRDGWPATDAKPGTLGRSLVFPYEAEWEGESYREKEVTVYYKRTDQGVVLLTVKGRYGQEFPRR